MCNQLRFSKLLLSLLLLAVFMSACGGGSDSGGGVPSVTPTFTPTAGDWAGTNIQFNVSTGGSSITMLLLSHANYSGACSGSTTFYSETTYPITNNNFSITFAGLTLTGHFSGPNNANGTYSFSFGYCGGTVSGSGSWTALPTV
jgi:hypothetical protein